MMTSPNKPRYNGRGIQIIKSINYVFGVQLGCPWQYCEDVQLYFTSSNFPSKRIFYIKYCLRSLLFCLIVLAKVEVKRSCTVYRRNLLATGSQRMKSESF